MTDKLGPSSDASFDAMLEELVGLHGPEYNRHAQTVVELFDITRVSLDCRVAEMRRDLQMVADQDVAKENGEGVYCAVADVLRSYLYLSDDAYVACALWCIYSHVYHLYETSPILVFAGRMPGIGKTRALGLVGGLSANSVSLTRPTAPAFLEMCNQGNTLLLDEVDTYFSKSDLITFLNAGFCRSTAGTTVRLPAGDVVTRTAFSPKVIAGIGSLPQTIHSRSIVVRMDFSRPPLGFRAEVINPQSIASVRARIAKWAKQSDEHLKVAASNLINADNSRKSDVWNPLFAIAEVLSPEIGEMVRRAAQDLPGQYVSPARPAAFEVIPILHQIADRLIRQNCYVISPSQLYNRLVELRADCPWPTHHAFAEDLKSLGLKTGVHRGDTRSVRGYDVTDLVGL